MSTDLFYREACSGDPVVLVHAGVADGRMWEPQVDALAQHNRVIVPDLRGFGRTPIPERPFSHATDLHGLADHLGIDRAAWVGCSLGGAAILDLTLEAPYLVDALVLSCAAISGSPNTDPVMRAGWDAAEAAYEAGNLAKAAQIEMEMWLVGPNRNPGAVPMELRELVVNMVLESYMYGEGDETDPLRPAVDHLEEISKPALVIHGAEDQAGSIARSELIARQIDGARLETILDAAHLPNLENPRRFNELVSTFLDEVYG